MTCVHHVICFNDAWHMFWGGGVQIEKKTFFIFSSDLVLFPVDLDLDLETLGSIPLGFMVSFGFSLV